MTAPELALDPAAVAAEAANERAAGGWVRVCPLALLIPGRGVAALVGGSQVAIFRLPDGEVVAVDQRDPCSGADVLSRGLVGDVAGEPTVASPVYKQRFALRDGRCLDDPTASVRVWPVRVVEGHVEVGVE